MTRYISINLNSYIQFDFIFRFKYITTRVSTVSQNLVASAEQELPPGLKLRSTSVTHHTSIEDTKN